MIDDLFTSDESLSLLDDHFAEETAPRRAAGRQPSVDTGEVFSVQSPVCSESHSFTRNASAATTFLIPTKEKCRGHPE